MSRMRTGKQNRLTPEEKIELKAKNEKKRDKYESQNMGKYILLYPLSDKIKSMIKDKNQAETTQNDDKPADYVPDQSILLETADGETAKPLEAKNKGSKKPPKDVKKAKNTVVPGTLIFPSNNVII
jgi:hypothetical protein